MDIQIPCFPCAVATLFYWLFSRQVEILDLDLLTVSNSDSCNGPGQFKLYKMLSERGLNSHMTYEIVQSTKSEYVSKLILMVNVYYHRYKSQKIPKTSKIFSSDGRRHCVYFLVLTTSQTSHTQLLYIREFPVLTMVNKRVHTAT